MSTFYVLPPREFLGERWADCVIDWLPGRDWSRAAWNELAEAVIAVAVNQPDVYVLHREDLPAEEDVARALIDGFGAAPGDEVVEVRAGGKDGAPVTRRWRLGGAAAA